MKWIELMTRLERVGRKNVNEKHGANEMKGISGMSEMSETNRMKTTNGTSETNETKIWQKALKGLT